MSLGKAITFSKLAFKDPIELWDRLAIKIEYLYEKYFLPRFKLSSSENFEEFLSRLGNFFQINLNDFVQEKALHEIKEHITQKNLELQENAPFSLIHNSDFTLAFSCYLLCRILKPAVVLETGVAYGVNSAFMLQALEKNQKGILYSIDLPPIGNESDDYIGYFIPENLKKRWKLFRGSSKRLMPKVLSGIGRVDVFVHDSLHTYYNMKREFRSVLPYLSSDSVIISDDVDNNAAFTKLLKKQEPTFGGIISEKEKDSSFGIYISCKNANPVNS